jgi:DNA polymerase (family 10)
MNNVNQDLAALFASMAGVLASRAENPYKVKAYQRAADSLRNLQEEVGGYAERGELRTIPGIGMEL